MSMANMLLTAAVWGLVYLLTDVHYTVLDPRIRLTKWFKSEVAHDCCK
jgi:ABC-type dipeptide/oligopeptide/nickel transport system permease component